ncbi:hypothetical protein ACFL6X_08945 [Candidatus Latescibacterota bacterium]
MRVACVAVAALWFVGCGERVDELGPYVQRLQTTESYWVTLLQYRDHLKSPDTESQAQDVREVIAKFQAEWEAFPEYDDKYITAGHNAVKRDLARTLTQLVEPDFPTFTVSALKQINLIEESMIILINNIEKRWKAEGKTEPYPLKWPGGE